jgi:serine phosphatase RsbU (regulator of sigma subunit)
MFVTLIAGLIDCRTGALAIANAGHEYPCLVRASGDVMRVETDGGPPLAVAPGFSYASETIQLAPGDTIVFVSDGITEAQNRAGGFFGSDRLEDALKRAAASAPVEDTSNALLRDVRLFEDGAEPTDDLTVLVFRYKG